MEIPGTATYAAVFGYWVAHHLNPPTEKSKHDLNVLIFNIATLLVINAVALVFLGFLVDSPLLVVNSVLVLLATCWCRFLAAQHGFAHFRNVEKTAFVFQRFSR